MKTIVSVCSARPNFVKVAAVHHALAAHPKEFKHLIVHTGQHYDPLLSDVFFRQLEIPDPIVNLGVHGGDRTTVIQQTEQALAGLLPELKPDIVLVYGDVNGAVGAALAAKKAGIRVGHVEAGLRSFDESMPEEHNRIAIDQIADVLLCSEQSGMEHLEKEKVAGKALLVGNTMIDTLIRMMPLIDEQELPELPASFAIVTMHRPSNVDDESALRSNMGFLEEVSAHTPLLLPVHHRLKASMEKFGMRVPEGVLASEPLGYLPFLNLVKRSAFILTDSGGIQEEATFLQKRCFTLRKNTERPSTIESGSNVLIDIEKESDRATVLSFAAEPIDIDVTVPELWDGKTGDRIVEILTSW